MIGAYPNYKYSSEDAKNDLVKFVRLDNTNGYAFDDYHSHEYNEILVFLQGGGVHNINFKEEKIKDNSIHLLAAKDLHWVERAKDSLGFAIVYKDQFLQKLTFVNTHIDYRSSFDHTRIINLKDEDIDSFSSIFQELLNNQANDVYMINLIGTFLTKIALSFYVSAPINKIQDTLLTPLIALIEQNYKQHFSTAHYAGLLNTSPSNLHRRIQKSSGKTVQNLQQERLLKEAKRLLITSGASVSEITYELGFKEPAHFTNWFKKQMGITPTEYKW